MTEGKFGTILSQVTRDPAAPRYFCIVIFILALSRARIVESFAVFGTMINLKIFEIEWNLQGTKDGAHNLELILSFLSSVK